MYKFTDPINPPVVDNPEEGPGDKNTPVSQPGAPPTTDSKADVATGKQNDSATPIVVGVSVGIICIIGAIAAVVIIRRKKGENTNAEEATEGKRYSQVPVNEIQVDDENQ